MQASRQRHQGAELFVKGMPVGAWQVNGGFQCIDAPHLDDPALDGQQPNNVPRFALSGEWAMAEGWALTAGLNHLTRRHVIVPNTFSVPASTAYDAGVRWEFEGGPVQWVARLNVGNLTEQHYWSSVAPWVAEFGAPRETKLSLDAKF